MTRKKTRNAVRQGKLTRFSLLRFNEAPKVKVSQYGFAKDIPRTVTPWRSIGSSIDFSPRADDSNHTSRAAREAMLQQDAVRLIAGSIAMAILALYIGVSLFAAEWDTNKWAEATSENVESSNVTSPSRDWRFRYTVYVTRWHPEMGAFVGKSIAFVALLVPAAFVAIVLAFVVQFAFSVGYQIWHLDPEYKAPVRLEPAPLPPDGYPWKFWKTWEQKRLLKRTLRQTV